MNKFLGILFVFSAVNITAQQNSFAVTYNSIKNSTAAVGIKTDSIYHFIRNNLRANDIIADSLSKDFMLYAEAQNNKRIIGIASLVNAMVSKQRGSNIEGITHALRSVNLLDSAAHLSEICIAYQLLAHFYDRTGNFTMSAAASLKALKIAETVKQDNLLFDSYNFLGISYIREKKINEAMELYRKAISVAAKSENKSQLTKVYTNLGIAFRNQQKWDSALHYHHKSLQLAKELNDKYDIAFALNDIGVIYLRIDDYPKALSYLLQSAEMREKEGEKWELGFTYNFIAEAYIYLGKYQQGEMYTRKAIANSYISKNIKQRYESYEYLSVINQYRERYDSAFYYLQKNATLKDSFQRARTNFMTDALIASYQFGEKEKEIKLLNETAENQKLQIQKQRLYLLITVIGVILFIIIVVLVVRTRKQTAKKTILEIKLKEESLKRIASENLQKEKERISRDLHDNVGGQLSYVLYSLDNIMDNDRAKREELSKNINESVKTVINNLRETIWAIHDEAILMNDLSDRLKVYTRSMFKNSSVKITFTEHIRNDVKLNSLVGLNLYRICQEIINNAFKHAQASAIKISIQTGEKTRISISDDGQGFDTGSVNSDSFGLSNIRSRASETGISVTMESVKGSGTAFILVV